MLEAKPIAASPSVSDPAFRPAAGSRWEAVRAAPAAIDPMRGGRASSSTTPARRSGGGSPPPSS